MTNGTPPQTIYVKTRTHTHSNHNSFACLEFAYDRRQASGDRRWDADDQYSKLIRETEAILSQLENDELLLTAFKIGESAA
jgi:hypothetical protein